MCGDPPGAPAAARPGALRPNACPVLAPPMRAGPPLAPRPLAGVPPPLAARIHGRADMLAPGRGRIARCGKACGATVLSRVTFAPGMYRGPALMCTVAEPRVSTRSFETLVVRRNIDLISRGGGVVG